MRYITNANNYIVTVAFGGDVECNWGGCTEYTGSVPTGYTSLEDWYADEGEKLYRWKIVNGQLTLDSGAPAPPDDVLIAQSVFVGDCNEAVKNGWYIVGAPATNAPSNMYGWMLVSTRNSYVWQDFYSSTLPARHFCRNYIDGIWSAWAEATPSAFAPSGYGLGSEKCNTDYTHANDCLAAGWYRVAFDVPFNDAYWLLRTDCYGSGYCKQTAYAIASTSGIDSMCVCRRYQERGAWSEWDWVNPPMAMGEEYRTTERWQGVPVYARAVNVGYVSAGSQSFAHNCAMKQPLSADVFNNGCELLTGYSGITNLTVSTTHVHFSGSNAFGDITFLLKYTK